MIRAILPFVILAYRSDRLFFPSGVIAGRAGTGYLNNYTLNLTLENTLLSAPSEALPFSLSLYYNSPQSNSYFTLSSNILTKSYSSMKVGYGWKLSAQQTVKSVTLTGATNPYLVYIAADGSAHYFQNSGSTYYDEDGLGLTITVSGVTYTMKDSEKNTWVFYNGYLMSYTDNNGNSLYYAYNETENSCYPTTWKPTSGTANQLTAVYRKNCGATNTDKLVTFSYTTSGVLERIKDQAGRITRFTYDETNPQLLISIDFPDGNTANYSYKSCTVYTGSEFWLLTDAEGNESSYRIHYTWLDEHATWWNSLLKLMRIYEIHEYAGNTAGQGMRAYKMSGTMSTFRYFGADCSPDNSDATVAN